MNVVYRHRRVSHSSFDFLTTTLYIYSLSLSSGETSEEDDELKKDQPTEESKKEESDVPAKLEPEETAKPASPDPPECSQSPIVKSNRSRTTLLKAHRLVLASCSPLIRKIFDTNATADNLTLHFPGKLFELLPCLENLRSWTFPKYFQSW